MEFYLQRKGPGERQGFHHGGVQDSVNVTGARLSPFMSSSAVLLHQPLEAPASIPLAQPSAQKENISFLFIQTSPGGVSSDQLVSLNQVPGLGDAGPPLVSSGSLACSWNLEVLFTQTSGRKSGPCYEKMLHS